jgi:hypothetical protein
MAKNRLIKSSKGNGYGILDEETNMVTPVSFDANKLIESKKGNGYGIQFGDSILPVDISGLGKGDIDLFKKKADTVLSGKTGSTAGKFEVPDSDSAWYDWDNIKKAGTNLIGIGKGLGQEIPSETTRMVGDLISSFGLAVDLGGRYSSAGINYLMGDKKQAQKDIDSDPTFLGKYLVDAGNYLSESADQTKDDTLKNWGVSEKNRSPQRSFYDAFSDGDLGDGSAMLFRDVLATVPQFAAAMLTGGGSLEAQALRKSGGLLRQTALSEMGAIASTELPAILSTGFKSQTGGQFKFGLGLGTTSSLAAEYKKDNHVTATDFLESIARGVIEGASESLFDTDILAAKKLASRFVNISDNPAVKGIMASIVGEGEDVARQKIVRTTTDILGKAFAGGRNEGLEEVASSFGNMLIDATKQGGFTMESLEKFKRDAIESFIVGSLSGGFISGEVARRSRVKLTDIQQKTIDRYNEVINDNTVSDEAKKVAKERIKNILDYSASLSKDNYALIAALPKEKRAEALGYLSSISKLEEDIKNTKDSEDGSYHSELNNGIKSYEDKVNNLIDEEYKSQREARRKETMSQSDIDTEDIINFFQSTGQQGFSIEGMDNALNDIRTKVNNKEEIEQWIINSANNSLYDIIDKIEKSELTAEQKKVASEPFFNQIRQLESYDKTIKTTEVTTPIQEITTTTRETGRRERPKTTVLTDRFNLEPVEVTDSEGNKSNYVAKVNEDGSISLMPKVKFSRTATEQRRKSIELDYNFIEFQESIKDENDRVVGARLLDKKTGNIIEISNPELAIDLALKAKQDALGNVSEGVMQQDTTVKPLGEMTSVVKEFVNKKAPVQAPVQEVQEETPEATLQTSLSPVGLPMRRAYVVGMDILKRTGNKILNKVSPENKAKINNNVKALKTILPNANVVLYDNREDMIQGLVNQGNTLEEVTQAVDESKGLYSEKGNTIHIDVTRMDKETLPHEIFHPLVLKLAQENPAEFRQMRSRISKALSGSDLSELNKFAELYDDKNKTKEQNDNIKAEEFLAQLGALMTSNKIKIERSRVQKVAMAIKDFIKSIAKKINSKALNDFADNMFSEKTKTEDLIKFFEGYARSLRQGAPIDTKYIDNLINTNKSARTAAQVTPVVILRAQKADVTKTPVAGNRLFNEPLADAKRIATEYMKKKGLEYKEGERITSVDKERAKKISDAYMAMPDNYSIPEVKASYDAMIAETIDQYKEIISNGYKVEINDTEPYKNAQEFIDDLRDNKNFKLLSTLSEFGDTPVTEEMANNDPRLKSTEFKDVNGQTLLANDLFRFVHDFFGHTVRGNSLGAIGEENAWDEHSRMYTPLARKAMTSETRGQNSYVNFSGVNDKAFKLRDIARKLRAEGNTKDADRLVNKVYEMMQFAPQKLGLMPDEFALRDDELKPSLRQQKMSSVKDINVKEIRTLSRAGNRVSKGLSVSTKDNKKVVQEAEDLSLEYVKNNAPDLFIANSNIIAAFPLVSAIIKKSNIKTLEDAQKVYDVFSREVANNLEYLMDNFNNEYKEISTLWYDGANILAQELSQKYNISKEQVAGIIASLSPQKDWYQNVRLAEMVLMAHAENPVMTKEMVNKQKLIAIEGLKTSKNKFNKANAKYIESKNNLKSVSDNELSSKQDIKEAKQNLKDSREDSIGRKEKYEKNVLNSKKIISSLEGLVGKSMSEVPKGMKGFYVRLWNEINTTKDYDVLRPDGQVMGVALKNNGKKAKVAWGSYTEINKANAIYLDGSQENITRSLGEMHKIRNFYNNIIDPMSKDEDVTMDTHAIAAALLMALSGKSEQVGQNFGTGTKNSSPLGIKGLYYAYAEGYKLAAKENNLLPRQVQSITWEAVRGLFESTFKGKKENVAAINKIWKEYSNNKISIDEARKQISDFAGGIKDPTWARPIQEGNGENIKQGDVRGGTDGTRRSAVGKSTGGRGGLRQQKTEDIAVDEAIKKESNKLKAQIVWQGSPYSFNKFNTDKIGTGNKSAFGGWGLYFTIEKARAAGYANQLKNEDIEIADIKISKGDYRYKELKEILQKTNSIIGITKELLSISKENRERSIKFVDEMFDNKFKQEQDKYIEASIDLSNKENIDKSRKIIKEFEDKMERVERYGLYNMYNDDYYAYRRLAKDVLSGGAKLNNNPSYLYEVSIADDLNLLDFDKRISDENYDKILNQAIKDKSKFLPEIIKNKDKNARDFYFNVSQDTDLENNDKELSLLMLSAGIDGNTMRSSGTQDIILFDSEAAKIVNQLRQQKKFPDALAESREEYENKNKNTWGEVSRYVRKLLSERNINIKKAMQDSELEFSLYSMYNKAGASMFGNLKFTEQFTKIYGNLSPEEIKLLDNFVFLRRVIAIEDNFDRRGEEKPKHPMHLNIDGVRTVTTKETAVATLNDYMDYLDLEVYDKVYTASDEYFKAFSDILKYKYENGLIDKDTYELYKNYNYSPRIFLEHIFGTSIGEEALSPNNFYQRGLNLSTPELKKIKDGSDTGIMVNSAKLLHAAMIATEVRVASNFALKTLYEEAIPRNLDFVKEVEYEKYADGTIKINEDGSLKYSTKADKDFRIVTFKENGLVTAFQLKENLAKEYFDEELFNKNSKAYKIAQMATGANILRNMATGLNIAFPITNIPIDAISQVQLNNIYDGASVGVAGQYAKVFTGTVAKSIEIIAHDFGMENKALEDLIYEYGKAGGLMMTLSEEYASKKGLLGQMSKYLGAFGSASEMGSKLTAYKTIKEREIAQFKDKNGQLPTGEEMRKIQTKAAYMARTAMDYHRGGLLTKWLDGFIPYFNVFTQGVKITADYIKENPTAFANKIIQTGLFVAALTIYNMAVAGADYDNDDNEQDLATKVVFFFPVKNEDGTRGKIEIAVPAPIKAFLNIFQNMGEGMYYKIFVGDGERYDEWKSNVNAKFLGMMSPNLSTNIPPAIKAMVEYSYNLDLWRGGKIVEKMGEILPEDEGRYDKNVSEFYKIIGTATGASPKRLQKASENFITQSNPLVGMGYSIMDKVVHGFANLPESERSKFNSGKISDIPVAFFDKIKGRVYSVTDPKITLNKGKDIIDKINQEAGSKKQEVKAEMRLLIENKASVKEMNDYLIKQDPIYRRSGRDYAKLLQDEKKLKYPNNKDEYFDIMTGANAEAKAQIIYAHFPHLFMEGNEDLKSDLKTLNLIGEDTKKYLTQYYKNKGIPK